MHLSNAILASCFIIRYKNDNKTVPFQLKFTSDKHGILAPIFTHMIPYCPNLA